MAAIGLLVLATLCLACPVYAEPIPLAVDQGRCEFVLQTPSAAHQFQLIVSSLAPASRSARITIQTQRAAGPAAIPVEQLALDPTWKKQVREQAISLERARRQRPALDSFPPLAQPPATKEFHLFMGERDLENPAQYQAVAAELHSLGRYCQIYVDRADKELAGLDATAAELRRVFDGDVFPWAERNLGRVVDVDRDGRFTLFLTRRLDKMHSGKSSVEGFVRGSDFLRDLPAPFSNRCDMLYLSASLQPGPHLRTVLAHEYTHAVTFCEHALVSRGGKDPTHQDEESWLSEGLAHLVEDLHGFSRSNLDYRIKEYLAGPEKYPLVVPDYFSAGLWRTPGQRGAAFLFLRCCHLEAGADLLPRLIQSPLQGVTNLEVATQQPFPRLFRNFTLSLPRSARAYGVALPWHEVPLDDARRELVLSGTSTAFLLLHSSTGGHARVQVVCDAETLLQVTLISRQ